MEHANATTCTARQKCAVWQGGICILLVADNVLHGSSSHCMRACCREQRAWLQGLGSGRYNLPVMSSRRYVDEARRWKYQCDVDAGLHPAQRHQALHTGAQTGPELRGRSAQPAEYRLRLEDNHSEEAAIFSMISSRVCRVCFKTFRRSHRSPKTKNRKSKTRDAECCL